MRAVALTAFNGFDSVTVTDLPDPTPGADEVLITVDGAGVGAWDAKTPFGVFAMAGGNAKFPQVLGWDFTGIVEIGDGGGRWHVGDAVLGFVHQPWAKMGSFGERMVVPADRLALRPAGLDPAVAAATPVTTLTADLAVRSVAAGPGTTILVLGGTGSVGGLAVQLAAAAGARVIASVRPEQGKAARDLGATDVIDRNGSIPDQVHALVDSGLDGLIDTVGPQAWTPAIAAVRRGGKFASTIQQMPDESLGLTSTYVWVPNDPGRLSALAEQVASGSLSVRVGEVLPLTAGPDALRRAGEGKLDGRLVLAASA
jgi:NADPH:quinone reductase-like Zn-dependent oxidoreductase